MLSRDEVSIAYRLILGREPESDAAYAAHQVEESLDDLGRRLLQTDEYRHRASKVFASSEKPAWVCAEIRHNLKLWLNLSDMGVSEGCLHDNWEPAETDLLLSVLQKGDTFIDVGANIGWFTILAAHQVGPKGRVFAFEPRDDCYRHLVQSVAANRFDDRCCIVPVALGAQESMIDLAWVPEEHNPGHSFVATGTLPVGAKHLHQVPMKPLDSFEIAPRVRAIKIDVEGAELEVLKGAQNLVARDKPVLILEVFPRWLREVGAATGNDMLEWLKAAGYRTFLLLEAGLGRELRESIPDGPGAPEYFNVVALSDEDCAKLLSLRLDGRVADLERRLQAAVERAVTADETGAEAKRSFEAALALVRTQTSERISALEATEARATRAEVALQSAHTTAMMREGELIAKISTLQAQFAESKRRFGQSTSTLEVRASEAISRAGHFENLAALHAETVERAADASKRSEAELAALSSYMRSIEGSTIWQATYPIRSAGKVMPPSFRRVIRSSAKFAWWAMTLQLPTRLRQLAALQSQSVPYETPIVTVQSNAPSESEHHVPLSIPKMAHEAVDPLYVSEKIEKYLPEKTRRRAFIVDCIWPQPDRDSGSLDALLLVRTLRKLGFEVVFTATAQFDDPTEYKERLESEGVIALDSTICASIEAFFELDGCSIDLCILSRVYAGGAHLETAQRFAPQACTIFNTVDLHHMREEREAALKKDTIALRWAERIREREFYIARQVDATIVVSGKERELLELSVPGVSVYELPLARAVGDDVPDFDVRLGVGFVGGFGHAPNVDAVSYLIEDIWPRVLKLMPDARLSIAGPDLPGHVLSSLPPSARYLGHVPDLDNWLNGLRLTVAPLRYGAGAKGKVASSLAAGVPCVATSMAAEGMGLVDTVNVIIATDADAFADAIVKVHQERSLWAELSANGHEKARQELSVASGEKRIASMLNELGFVDDTHMSWS